LRMSIITLILSLPVFLIGGILNFTPSNYDFVVLFDDPATNFSLLKEVPFFSYVLEEEGLGMEYVFMSVLKEVEDECGVPEDVFLDAVANDFLISSNGVTVELNSLTSFDVNYYIDILRNLGSNTIVVFQSSKPQEFLRFLACILNLNLKEDGGYYIMRDEHVTVFGKIVDDYYIVISGSKSSIDLAIANYSNPSGGILEEASKVLNEEAFIKGYFKKNTLKIEMGMNVEKEDVETDHFEMLARVEEGKFLMTVDQFVTGDLEKPLEYVVSSEDMGEVPYMGNYFVGISARSSIEAVKSITSWFSGRGGEVEKISEIVSTIVKGASGKIYIVGDISSASEVTFAAIINESEDWKEEIKKVLVKYGAENEGDQWILKIEGEDLYFFWYKGKCVISNVSAGEFSTFYNRKKLLDDPTFNYLTSFIPRKEDISRAYLDLGDLMKKITGIELSSKMLFFQTYEKGKFIYILEVM
jgi:hypothetical protein